MDELQLLKNLIAGQADSYRPIVEKYQSHIYHICLAQVRQPDVAEDIAQEAFIKAYQSITTLRDLSKFSSWLKRIAVNLSRDYLKSHRPSFIMFEDEISLDGLSGFEPFGNTVDVLEAEAIENELYSRLYDLDLEKRNVLFLYYIYELPGKDIAERLGISQSAVKKRLERARKTLKEVIKMKKKMSPSENFSSKVIELIKRPNLIEKAGNPVAKIWSEVSAFLNDYKVIEGEELISKDELNKLAKAQTSIPAVEVDKKRVLRSHTTTIVMEHLKDNSDSPCKVVGVGRVWRDMPEDKGHLKMFHQTDTLWMDKGVREGDLLTMINDFMEVVLPGRRWTIENKTFPFTKRGYLISVENDKGKFLDIAGAGEIKEAVLKDYGVNTTKYRAVAYGIGLERLAMIKYGIDSIQEATTVIVKK